MTPTDPPARDVFESLANFMADVLCRVDTAGIVTYASPSCFSLLGYTPAEMVGKSPQSLVFADDLSIVMEAMSTINDPLNATESTTVRLVRKNGSLVWAETNARIVRDPETAVPLELVMIMRDITEHKRLEEKLSSLALTDGLTGLVNRRAFDDAFDREWRRVVREASGMSLLLLDVDHFKQMNDLYGHVMGDDCLRILARAIESCLRRPYDIAARYGGEEFAVILPNAEAAGAVTVAERIRRSIEDLRITNAGNPEGGGVVTVSVGVATALARQGGSFKMPDSLLLAADTALYKAKLEGRNRIATGMLLTSPGQRS